MCIHIVENIRQNFSRSDDSYPIFNKSDMREDNRLYDYDEEVYASYHHEDCDNRYAYGIDD